MDPDLLRFPRLGLFQKLVGLDHLGHYAFVDALMQWLVIPFLPAFLWHEHLMNLVHVVWLCQQETTVLLSLDGASALHKIVHFPFARAKPFLYLLTNILPSHVLCITIKHTVVYMSADPTNRVSPSGLHIPRRKDQRLDGENRVLPKRN